MSNTYFRVAALIKEILKENSKWSSQQIWALSILLANLFLWIFSVYIYMGESSNFFGIVALIISLVLTIFFIVIIKSMKIDYLKIDKRIILFNKRLFLIDIDTEQKVMNLQKEILTENNKLDKERNVLYKRLSKVFMYIFWIPLGFLMAFYINAHPSELSGTESISVILLLLFQLASTIIGLVVAIGTSLDNIFDFKINERQRVYRYLEDVKYKYYLKNEK